MASAALGESDRTRARPISATDAAALVGSGDWVEYGTGIGQPDVFDAALAERVEELEDVKIRACLTLRPRAVLEADPGRAHFHWFNWHYTGYDRAKGDLGLRQLHPLQPRRDPRLLPALHRPAGDRRAQDVPQGRARLLQLQPRDTLAPRDRRARAGS